MRSLLLVVLTVFVALSAAAPKWSQLEGYNFKKYVRDFGRQYAPGSAEYKKREIIFETKMEEIRRHNADPTQSWKMGVNHFSDWSAEEFKRYNTYRKYPNGPQPKSIHQAPVGSSASDFPKFVDWRKNNAPRVITDIKNQGACGNCWANSATESIESYFALLTGQLPVLSVQQITSCTTTMDGCGGGDPTYGWEYVQNSTGLNEEWVYPFVDFFAANESMQATAPCKNITKEFLPNFPWYPKATVTGFVRVAPNDDISLMHALSTIGPQSVAVAASLWGGYEGGIYQNAPNNQANWEIDHVVQIVGYGYDFLLNMNYWIVRNSWGTQWGEEGYIRLARPDQEPCGLYDYGNMNVTVCGTSAVLAYPDRPMVATLEQVNP